MTDVKIEAPSLNTRKISASIIVDTPMQEVWSILTDYNNLATHVPNLVKSYVVPNAAGDIRLFQEGAQKIIGFDFRASLFMQMQEEKDEDKYESFIEKIDRVWKKIKDYRKSGLESESGEFSVGNLVFKLLRRNGYIGKVMKMKKDNYDKQFK